MLYYLKKYPISLTIIAVVIYLSFFKPPSLEVGKSWGQTSGSSLYVCRLVRYAVDRVPAQPLQIRRCVVACLDRSRPVPGLDERSNRTLQEYCTTYRGGDWFDLLANICGVTLATLFSYLSSSPGIIEEKDWYSLGLCIYPSLVVGLPIRSRHLMNLDRRS